VTRILAKVTDKAVLRLSEDMRKALDQHLKTLVDQDVEIIVRKPQSKRSIDQNAWLHCDSGPVRLLADEWGVSMAEAKLLLMGECWGWREVNGRQIPVRPQTSEMTVKDFSYFVDWVVPWAMTEFNVRVMLPSEMAA
jgi:hypothetical protein